MLIFLAGQGFRQGVLFDVVGPFGQMVHHHEDGVDLMILQLGGHDEVVPGGFQVVLGPLTAGGLDLAEPAVVAGLEA